MALNLSESKELEELKQKHKKKCYEHQGMSKNLKTKARARSVRSFVRGVIDGTIKAPDKAVVFHITDKQMFETITRKRLELIRVIKKKMPKSIMELARLVNRTKQAVDRDLKILERNALVSLEKKGKIVTPIVEKEAMIYLIY